MGGDLLPVEVLAKPGTGGIAVVDYLDGCLGHQASAAARYVRRHVTELAPDLAPGWLERNDLRIDVPYGVTPASLTTAEAASAGLAIAAALTSLLSGRIVRTEVAVTGGLTEEGELLPVRGFRDKAHCAKRGYAQLLLAPTANEPDIHQVSQQNRRDLWVIFAATLAEAFRVALAERPAMD